MLHYVISGSTKFMPSSSIDSIRGNVVLSKFTEVFIDSEVNCAWELIFDLIVKKIMTFIFYLALIYMNVYES